MIVSVGYSKLTPEELTQLVTRLRVELFYDVRSVPHSRKPGFTRNALERRFGSLYVWRPDLGGRTIPTVEAIATLFPVRTRRVLLLCLEEAPGDCHRHHTVALPLWRRHNVDTHHVFQDHVVLASNLQRAIDTDSDYDSVGLDLFIKRTSSRPS